MKARILLITNILLACSAATQIATGLAMELEFKPAEEIHEVNGYILTVLILAHVVQNWGWVRGQLRRRK